MPRYPLMEPSKRLCHFTLFAIQAFKFLEDSTEDGADSLYGCIWDMAILSLANAEFHYDDTAGGSSAGAAPDRAPTRVTNVEWQTVERGEEPYGRGHHAAATWHCERGAAPKVVIFGGQIVHNMAPAAQPESSFRDTWVMHSTLTGTHNASLQGWAAASGWNHTADDA